MKGTTIQYEEMVKGNQTTYRMKFFQVHQLNAFTN